MKVLALFILLMARDSYCALFNGQIPGCQMILSFNENSGTNTADGSGNGWNGYTTNSPPWTNGYMGSAILFNGSSQLVFTSFTNVYTNMTVVWAFFQPNLQTNAVRCFWGENIGTKSVDAQLFSDNNFYIGCSEGTDYRVTYAASAANYVIGKWGVYAVTMSSNAVPTGSITYFNGVPVKTNATAPSMAGFNSPLFIAKQGVNGVGRFTGAIDNFMVFNRILSPAEIGLLQYTNSTGSAFPARP